MMELLVVFVKMNPAGNVIGCHCLFFMVTIVICWILVCDCVEELFHYMCSGVVLLKYNWIWISACTVIIILLI